MIKDLKDGYEIKNEIADIVMGEISSVRSDEYLNALEEILRLQSLTQWVRYIEGDMSTYPQQEGLFNIITKSSKTIPDGNKSEFYNFYHGWATDEEIEWYQPLPPEGVK